MAGAKRQSSTAARAAFAICIAIAALIHLLPVVGVLGVESLQALYGIEVDDATLAILLRHRALLFGLLGVLLLVSIRRRALRSSALTGGIISTASFLLIVLDTEGYAPVLQRVVIADVIALLALLIAAFLHRRTLVEPSLLG